MIYVDKREAGDKRPKRHLGVESRSADLPRSRTPPEALGSSERRTVQQYSVERCQDIEAVYAGFDRSKFSSFTCKISLTIVFALAMRGDTRSRGIEGNEPVFTYGEQTHDT